MNRRELLQSICFMPFINTISNFDNLGYDPKHDINNYLLNTKYTQDIKLPKEAKHINIDWMRIPQQPKNIDWENFYKKVEKLKLNYIYYIYVGDKLHNIYGSTNKAKNCSYMMPDCGIIQKLG